MKRDGSVGIGSYTMEYRRLLLARLKDLQDRVWEVLITPEEEALIQTIWAEETADLVQLTERRMGAEVQ